MKHFFLFTAIFLLGVSVPAQTSDAALRRAIDDDKAAKAASDTLPTVSAAEHLARAEAYSANRLFPEAREHWQKVFDNYPDDAGIPKALFGTARSFMWERNYGTAVEWFSKLTKDHLGTKDGREGLSFKAASYVRMGKNLDAAKTYEQYVAMFPRGERIESAHLNIIDAYREAGRYDDANKWVDRTAREFAGKPSEVNALHARIRLEIYRENWNGAVGAADRLIGKSFRGSMASADEVKYLRALALDKSGKKSEAATAYSTISRSDVSYFGGLVAEKHNGVTPTSSVGGSQGSQFPLMFKTDLLREARKHKVDPRFLLAIMKQESSFRANAKSPAGARGLLQLVFDTAIKYKNKAGYPALKPDDLYRPAVSIALGAAYVGSLKNEFGGLYEAIAASYNSGEDNAARWLNRTKPKDPGIFAAEVGFAETKNYVFKVMNNYRVYRDLYTEQLVPR